MVLQQNWPTAFKRVDQVDPAGVWKANIDDLTSHQIELGLKELRRCDERYMPNAPTIRAMFKDTTRIENKPAEPADPRDEIELLFVRLRSVLWMHWSKTMIIARGCEISRAMATTCCTQSHNVIVDYERAWRTEEVKDADNWKAIAHGVVNECLRRWNSTCKIPPKKRIRSFEELYPER
jgi:hypothetical protein